MNLNELYKEIEKIGVFVFSTNSLSGEVQSRIAHFNGFDQNGLYFRTMDSKPFFRQLMQFKKVSVCGITDNRILGYDQNSVPSFPQSTVLRIVGEIIHIDSKEIIKRAKTNSKLQTAVNDMTKYPSMVNGNFQITRAKVEIMKVDFDLKEMDHKLLRKRFSFNGYPFHKAGPTISDNCIGCNKCLKVCSFDAIERKDGKCIIDSTKCDDCGSCINICPISAIRLSDEF